MAASMAPTVAAAAIAPAVAAMTAMAIIAARAAVAAAATKGRSLVLAADQSDSDEGEEHRHAQHDNTIHPQFLQILTGTVSENSFAGAWPVPLGKT
jgi:hypothetical protein